MRRLAKINCKIFFNHGERVNGKIRAVWDVSQRQILKSSLTMVKEWIAYLMPNQGSFTRTNSRIEGMNGKIKVNSKTEFEDKHLSNKEYLLKEQKKSLI